MPLADDAALAAAEAAARTAAETSRTALAEAMQGESRLADVKHGNPPPISCNQEASAWQQRLDGASGRIAELEKRLIDGNQEQRRLKLPETISKQRLEIGDRLEIAEQSRQDAADALRLAEISLDEADHCNASLTMPLRQRVKTKSAPKPAKNAATPPCRIERPHCG